MLSRAALKAMAKQGNTNGTVIINASLKEAVYQFQREVIKDSLKRHEGNLASTGREPGISRSNFYRLLKRLELQ